MSDSKPSQSCSTTSSFMCFDQSIQSPNPRVSPRPNWCTSEPAHPYGPNRGTQMTMCEESPCDKSSTRSSRGLGLAPFFHTWSRWSLRPTVSVCVCNKRGWSLGASLCVCFWCLSGTFSVGRALDKDTIRLDVVFLQSIVFTCPGS